MKLQAILDKKNNNFDLLRLMLAYLVIYSHSIALLNQSHDIFLTLTHIKDGGSIAVKCFFFISGLLVGMISWFLIEKRSIAYGKKLIAK